MRLLRTVLISCVLLPVQAKADPPVVVSQGGTPATVQVSGLNLTPVAAADVARPTIGLTLFVDAATGKLCAKDTAGKVVVVVLEGAASAPASTPVANATPAPNSTPASVPNSTPASPPPPTVERQLVGGWRVANPFGRGSIGIDWSTRTLAMGGHTQQNTISFYDLPATGKGTDPKQWPAVKPRETVQAWWPTDCYASGVVYWKGDWWVSPRKYYDTSPPGDQTWYSRKGETLKFPTLPRGQFHGMVKVFGKDPMPGGGGYESGQGSAFGPTLALADGTIKINHNFNGSWEKREKREPNYWPSDHKDGWTALEPRVVNGVKEGRWACDRIYGGGLLLLEGYCYWPEMGIGDISYARQNGTFAATNKTYLYRYDPVTFKLIGWKETDLGQVLGQEHGPNGEVVLSIGNVWKSELYQVDPIVEVFEDPKASATGKRPTSQDGPKK